MSVPPLLITDVQTDGFDVAVSFAGALDAITVDWGDGTEAETLDSGVDTASYGYALLGRYLIVASTEFGQSATASVELVAHVVPYTTTDELFRVLRIRNPTTEQVAAGQRVIDSAAFEIDSEVGRPGRPYGDPPPALAAEVNLERATEHWEQAQSPFAIIGLGDGVPTATARNSWERHAYKLAPLKETWGIA